MNTTIYLVRHAHADLVSMEKYRERNLSERGKEEAKKLLPIFEDIPIDVFISSASPRAMQTIQPLAEKRGKHIETYTELQELQLRGAEHHIEASELKAAIQQVFENGAKFPGGESRSEVEKRGLQKFRELIEQYRGKSLVLGTHGIIMTLILASYDPSFGFEFWKSTSKPDVYKLVLSESDEMVNFVRLTEI